MTLGLASSPARVLTLIVAGGLLLCNTPGRAQAAGATQDLLVSTRVVGFNRLPTVATDPATGNVFVAWARLTAAATTSEVWGTLLKRSASGKYTVKKAFRLSKGNGFNTNPSVAWLPKRKRFFVAWDTAPIFLRKSQILGRLINRKGLRPQGGVKTIVSGNFFNQLPIVTASVVDGVQEVRIFYTRAPNATGVFIGQPAGVDNVKQKVVSQKLKNATLRARGNADVHVSSNNLPEGASVLFWDGASPFECGVLLVREIGTGRQIWFLKLVLNGKVRATQRLGEATSIKVIEVGNTDDGLKFDLLQVGLDQIATVTTFEVDKKSIKLKKKEVILLRDDTFSAQVVIASIFLPEADTSRAGAGGGVSVYAVTAESDGWVRSRKFNQNGKLTRVGDPVELFEPGNAIQSLDAVDLPAGGRGPDAAVVWTKAISPTRQEIHAHVFTAEP